MLQFVTLAHRRHAHWRVILTRILGFIHKYSLGAHTDHLPTTIPACFACATWLPAHATPNSARHRALAILSAPHTSHAPRSLLVCVLVSQACSFRSLKPLTQAACSSCPLNSRPLNLKPFARAARSSRSIKPLDQATRSSHPLKSPLTQAAAHSSRPLKSPLTQAAARSSPARYKAARSLFTQAARSLFTQAALSSRASPADAR